MALNVYNHRFNEPLYARDIEIASTGRINVGNQTSNDVTISNVYTPLQINRDSFVVVVDANGNIGIGTVIPTSKLHVVGDALISNKLHINSGPLLVGSATSTGTASQPLQVTGGGYFSGSVGIGTTTPNQALHIQGNLNVVGYSTALDRRILSIGEKTTLIDGNTVSLSYSTGGGNIAICTSATGDITLSVSNIPTDSSFDNNALTFSVIVLNVGTARSCTAVSLNGLTRTIRWFGGSLTSAISGVTTTSGYDIYSFTGINTVGSASTTANYVVLGNVNGSYR